MKQWQEKWWVKLPSEIIGLNELLNNFRKIGENGKTLIEDALVMGALRVERDAKINAPVNKQKGLGGRLRSSITHLEHDFGSSNPYVEVGTNVEYAKFQEFGTGQRGSQSNVPTPADYEYGSSKGIPAQPFLFPAYNSNKKKILNDIAEALRNVGKI